MLVKSNLEAIKYNGLLSIDAVSEWVKMALFLSEFFSVIYK